MASILIIYLSEVRLYPFELVNIQFLRPNFCIHQHLFKQEYGFTIKLYLPPPPPLIALAAVRSKEVVLLLFIHCLLLPHCLWGSVFDACFTLCPPSFAISLMGKRKLVAKIL